MYCQQSVIARPAGLAAEVAAVVEAYVLLALHNWVAVTTFEPDEIHGCYILFLGLI